MIGVFARSDHPPGYGYAPREGEGGGRAHGYVVLLVRCADEGELTQVRERLWHDFKGFDEGGYAKGQLLDWYGGKFDHLATIVGPAEVWLGGGTSRFLSRGDNRFVGIYEATEVLAA